MKLPVVFLAGPTASGKTALAMHLYDRLECELINVDAAQVYKNMDIGTAKISKSEQLNYPHKLIDIREPWQTYSAADFCDDVLPLINESHANGKLPILVGGSMFYFNALENGLSKLPKADHAIRHKIEDMLNSESIESLHQRLKHIDRDLYQTLKPSDSQRIKRALEIYMITQQSPTHVFKNEPLVGLKQSHRIIKMAITMTDRKLLHEIIAKRYHQMIENGLVDEVESFFKNPKLSADIAAMKIVGYRQTWEYLNGDYDLETSIFKGIAATRQLAKRQLTWLRNQAAMTWFINEDQFNAKDSMLRFINSSLAASYSKK